MSELVFFGMSNRQGVHPKTFYNKQDFACQECPGKILNFAHRRGKIDRLDTISN